MLLKLELKFSKKIKLNYRCWFSFVCCSILLYRLENDYSFLCPITVLAHNLDTMEIFTQLSIQLVNVSNIKRLIFARKIFMSLKEFIEPQTLVLKLLFLQLMWICLPFFGKNTVILLVGSALKKCETIEKRLAIKEDLKLTVGQL